jgi:hypothetical protein
LCFIHVSSFIDMTSQMRILETFFYQASGSLNTTLKEVKIQIQTVPAVAGQESTFFECSNISNQEEFIV